MNKIIIGAGLVLLSFLSSVLLADTLQLADGTVMEGDFVGSSNGIIMFDVGDSIEAFPESEVVGIFLSSGVATAEQATAAPEPADFGIAWEQLGSRTDGGWLTVPVGYSDPGAGTIDLFGTLNFNSGTLSLTNSDFTVGGAGSYDEQSGWQVGSRDGEIAGSPASCR